MKALTVLQPWATLLALGVKRVETRSWQTKRRGTILIHAGRRRTDARRLAGHEPFASLVRSLGYTEVRDLPCGVLLGQAELVDCVPAEMIVDELGPQERALGNFSPGRWAWLIERPVPFAVPLPCRGALGLFDVADSELSPAPCN